MAQTLEKVATTTQIVSERESETRPVVGDGFLSGDGPRVALEEACGELGDGVGEAILGRINSEDRRRAFQGFAELSVATLLERWGWQVRSLDPIAGILNTTRPSGEVANVLVLGFLHSSSPRLDVVERRRLEEAVAGVESRKQFSIFVRRLLPAEFDAVALRAALDEWLEGAGRFGKVGRYSADGVVIEFLPSRVRCEQGASPLQAIYGPFISGRSALALEARAVRAFDRYYLTPELPEPLLLAAVSNRPWQLSCGHLRELFYGVPRWTECNSDGSWRAGLSDGEAPCIYRDPLFGDLLGSLLLGRDGAGGLGLLGRGYSNPFSDRPLAPSEITLPLAWAGSRDERNLPVISWENPDGEAISL